MNLIPRCLRVDTYDSYRWYTLAVGRLDAEVGQRYLKLGPLSVTVYEVHRALRLDAMWLGALPFLHLEPDHGLSMTCYALACVVGTLCTSVFGHLPRVAYVAAMVVTLLLVAVGTFVSEVTPPDDDRRTW